MTHRVMAPHLAKLPSPVLPSGATATDWHWPYPHDHCSCGAQGFAHGEPGHEDCESKMQDAVHADIVFADGSKDFIRISGEHVRNSTAGELHELLAVQTFGRTQ